MNYNFSNMFYAVVATHREGYVAEFDLYKKEI